MWRSVAGATGITRPTVTSTLAKLVADDALSGSSCRAARAGTGSPSNPPPTSALDGGHVSHEDVEGELVDEDVAEQPA